MRKEKKHWFYRVSYNLWIPISWEGAIVMALLCGGLFLIYRINSPESGPISGMFRDWRFWLEMGALFGLFYLVSWGRVRR